MRNWKSWLVIVAVVGLQMYSHIFICWVLLHTFFVAGLVWLLLVGLFRRLQIKNPDNKIKVFLVRTMITAFSLAGIYLFAIEMGLYRAYMDLPAYFKEEYVYQEGYAHLTSSSVSGVLSQTITINGVTLDNHQFVHINDYQGRRLRVYYLPPSKYVMEIWRYP